MSYYVRCPYCRQVLDGSVNPSGRAEPRDWDPAVCSFCGNVSVFEHGVPGGLRRPTKDDWPAWDADVVLKTLQLMHLILTMRGRDDERSRETTDTMEGRGHRPR